MENTVQKQKNRRLDAAVCAALALLTFLVTFVFSVYGGDPHHDGVMFEAALKVARGATLFRDTFTQYGSLAIYYDALFIRLFGESMRSIQLAACVALAGCSVLIYCITQKLTPRIWAVGAATLVTALNYVYFWHSHPWSSVLALFFQLLGCKLFLSALSKTELAEKNRLSGSALLLLAFSGACGALSAFCRLPVGLLCFFAGACALVLLQVAARESAAAFFKKLLGYATGFGIMLVLLFLPILLSHTWDAWWGMIVVGTAGFAAETNTAGASTGFLVRFVWDLFGAWILRNPLIDCIWLLLPACMGFTLLAVGWGVLKAYFENFRSPQIPQIEPIHRKLVVVCVFAFASWAQYYPVVCYRHWFWAAVPMFPILIYDVKWLFDKKTRVTRFVGVLMALLLMGNIAVRGRFALATLGAWDYEKNPGETRPGITSFYLEENWNRTGAAVYQNASQPYLNGLLLNADTARFYDELFARVEELKAENTDVNFINRTAEGFLGVFQTEYMPYGNAPYSQYTTVENQYIAEKKPVVITQSETDWQGYTEDYQVYAKITGNDGRIQNAVIYLMTAE